MESISPAQIDPRNSHLLSSVSNQEKTAVWEGIEHLIRDIRAEPRKQQNQLTALTPRRLRSPEADQSPVRRERPP